MLPSETGRNTSNVRGAKLRFLLLVDALSADVAAFAGGDERIAFHVPLDQRVLLLIIRVHLSMDHFFAIEGDCSIDGSVVGRDLLELYALLEFDHRRFKRRHRLHLPTVFGRLGHDEIGSELVAQFPQKETDADVAHKFVETLLRLQSPSAQ